jgi:hypothetical protein
MIINAYNGTCAKLIEHEQLEISFRRANEYLLQMDRRRTPSILFTKLTLNRQNFTTSNETDLH